MYNIPILYIVFNRPEETKLSFEVLKKLKPSKLYVAADGPRLGNESDFVATNEVRNIINTLDWECEIKTLYRNENLGCGTAVQSALDWFFSEVEMGIIIEDDIIPNPSFFKYCEVLLHKFKDNPKVFSINGCSLAYENSQYDYGLTRYFNMWGWATWRRSNQLVKKTWPKYDQSIDFKKGSTFLKTLQLPTIFPQDEWINKWIYFFESTKSGKIDTWDYQWVYTCLKNEQYCLRPNLNQITNIGFSDNSTHTSQAPHIKLNNMKVHTLKIEPDALKGKWSIEKKYEIQHVAGYWNAININYKGFLKKTMWFIKIKLRFLFKKINV